MNKMHTAVFAVTHTGRRINQNYGIKRGCLREANFDLGGRKALSDLVTFVLRPE